MKTFKHGLWNAAAKIFFCAWISFGSAKRLQLYNKSTKTFGKKLQTFYLISLSDNLKTRRDYASSTDLVNA